MTYSSEGNEIVLDGGRRVRFDFPILEFAERDGVCVVDLDVPPKVTMTENVFGVSSDGVVLWQIEWSECSGYNPTSRYVGFVPCDKAHVVRIANWTGWVADVDVRSGKILNEYFAK